jgi:hypothetical protein
MAFPSSPSNGQIVNRFGRKYQYNQDTEQWRGVQAVAPTTIADIVDEEYIAARITASGTGVTTYNTLAELPLADNTAGAQAFVAENNRLYIWNGSGWYNIALINTAPSITSGGDGSYVFATDGTPIVITLQAQDPEEVPIAWSYAVTSGALGSTATVSQADNVFTITPSTDPNDTGGFSITFTASDGVNLATSVSAFTLVFGAADQYYNNNSLLLKSGSTAGLNNTTFVDESTNDFTVTSGGDVYQGSLSPYSPAGWGVYFDGTGDYLTLNTSTELTGEFTLELWLYLNDVTSGHYIISQAINSSVTSNWGITSTGFSMQLYGGARGNQNGVLTYNVASLVGSWNHLALEFNGSNSYQVFVNGVSIGTQPNVTSPWHSEGIDAFTVIGAYWYNAATSPMNGVISNLCITKGLRKYGTNFTPPTYPFTADANTALLIAQSNRFIDNSSNNSTITKYGDTKAVPFSPYLPSSKYVPTVHGGSAYFDGTGDSLSAASNTAFAMYSGTFTFECFLYINALPGSVAGIFDTGSSVNSNRLSVVLYSSGKIYLDSNANLLISDAILSVGQWYHIAIVREGTGSDQTKLYVNGVLNKSSTVSTDFSNSNCKIGQTIDNLGLNGYLSNLRLVKGSAVYTADFTPPTEPLTAISGTSLLLNMNNAGIYDETAKNNIKVIGNTTTSTTQTKYNDTAMYFDGTGDYIEVDANTMAFGTGDFTIEAWIYPTSTGNGMFRNTTSAAAGTIPGVSLYFSSNLYYLSMANSSSVGITLSSSHNWLNKWSHIAITRESGTARFFIDGVLSTSGTSTHDLNTGVTLRIGEWRSAAEFYDGYISDLRITKGVARYTDNFTPPTAALGFNNEE